MATRSFFISFLLLLASLSLTATTAQSPTPSPSPDSGSPSPSSNSPHLSPPAPPTSDLHSPASAPSPVPTPSDETSPAPAPAPEAVDGSKSANAAVIPDDQIGGGGSGMSGGKKAGIAVGLVAAVCVVGLGGMIYRKRQQNVRRAQYGYAARSELL